MPNAQVSKPLVVCLVADSIRVLAPNCGPVCRSPINAPCSRVFVPALGSWIKSPRVVEPAGLAVNIGFPANLVLKLRILSLLYVVKNFVDVLVPRWRPSGRRAGQR